MISQCVHVSTHKLYALNIHDFICQKKKNFYPAAVSNMEVIG